MRRIFTLSLSFLLLFAFSLYAQEYAHQKWQVEGSFGTSTPISDLNKVTNAGYSYSGAILYSVQNNLVLGIEQSYSNMPVVTEEDSRTTSTNSVLATSTSFVGKWFLTGNQTFMPYLRGGAGIGSEGATNGDIRVFGSRQFVYAFGGGFKYNLNSKHFGLSGEALNNNVDKNFKFVQGRFLVGYYFNIE